MSSSIELSVDETQELEEPGPRRNKAMEATVAALIQLARYLVRSIAREILPSDDAAQEVDQ